MYIIAVDACTKPDGMPNRNKIDTYKDINMLTYKIPPLSPYVTYEEYSRITGLPIGTIKMYVEQGRVIIKPKKRRRDKTPYQYGCHARNSGTRSFSCSRLNLLGCALSG